MDLQARLIVRVSFVRHDDMDVIGTRAEPVLRTCRLMTERRTRSGVEQGGLETAPIRNGAREGRKRARIHVLPTPGRNEPMELGVRKSMIPATVEVDDAVLTQCKVE